MFGQILYVLLSLYVILCKCDLTIDDCVTPSTPCCNLAVESIKPKKFYIKGSCEDYWKNRGKLLANIDFTDYKCDGWTCECQDFEARFKERSNFLLEKEADQHCAGSRPAPHTDSSTSLASSWVVCIGVVLGLYSLNYGTTSTAM